MAHITRKMEVLRHFPLPATIVLLAIGIALGIALLGFVSAAMRSKTVPVASSAPAPAPSVLQAEQPFDTAQGKPIAQPAQKVPEVVAPVVPVWPVVQVNWKYTDQVVPTPPGVDETYSGELVSNTIEANMAIVRRIIPESMINGDAVGLSIVRNPDNPNIRLAALTIHRGTGKMWELAAQQKIKEAGEVPVFPESHLYLTTDSERSWVEIANPRAKADIESVRVSGTSTLTLSIQGASNHFFWQAVYVVK